MSGENHIVVGKLSLDRFRYEVRIQKREIRLTRMEFTLLWTLASQAGKVFRREELLDQLWGPGRFVEPRTVDVHVTRLRRKLQAHWRSPTVVIETVWGVGYRLRNSHSSSHIAAHRPAASVPGVHPGRLRSSKVLSDTHREEDGSEDFTEL